MRKFIVLAAEDHPYCKHPGWSHWGPEEIELSPFTPLEFEMCVTWTGMNDVAYEDFKRHNKLHDVEDFNEEARCGARVITKQGDTRWDISRNYGSGED